MGSGGENGRKWRQQEKCLRRLSGWQQSEKKLNIGQESLRKIFNMQNFNFGKFLAVFLLRWRCIKGLGGAKTLYRRNILLRLTA